MRCPKCRSPFTKTTFRHEEGWDMECEECGFAWYISDGEY